MKEELIAPCGMDCGLCVSYLAKETQLSSKGFKKRYCDGCLPRGKHCLFMRDSCELLGKGKVRFCFECGSYPCRRLKSLDERYRANYHMSMTDNLEMIREHGVESFLAKEEEKWKCPKCGGTICCHNGLCLVCDIEKLRKKKSYRWDEDLRNDS